MANPGRRLRFVLLQSRTRGPSGEKVMSEQLAAALSARLEVEQCLYLVTDRYPGHPEGVVSAELLDKIREAAPDVLINFSVWGPRLPVDAYQVFIHCNMWRGGYDHNGTPEELAGLGFDLYLTNSRACLEVLRDNRCRAVYWPLFTDPELFRPVPPVEEHRCEVVYVGGNLSFKTPGAVERYLEPCAQFDFRLYGLDWESHPTLTRFARGVLPEGKVHEVYSSAAVVVGFNAPTQARWGMVNDRVFEALSCEACFLSDRIPEIEREFAGACAFTDGGEDTVRQIRYLLDHPQERARMGKAGRQLVLHRDTVHHRVETLMQALREVELPQRPRALARPRAVQEGRPTLCLKHHWLRDNQADVILANPRLRGRFQVMQLTEPFGTQVSRDMWRDVPRSDAVAVVWGMRKYGAAEFADYAREIGLPLVFIERSPLLKNGRRAYYFDPFGTTDHGLLCRPGAWEAMLARPFGDVERAQLDDWRRSYSGLSDAVEPQAVPFQSREEILAKLGLPADARILFVPLQVNDDITIIDKQSSPFIDNILQFVTLIMNNADCIPEPYYVIIKEHPANIRYGHELAHGLSHPRVLFIRDEVNANALTQQCDAVLSINSGVGMEALAFHKPVIACGNSFYSGKGINWDVRSEDQLRRALQEIDDYQVDRERVDRFVHCFVFHYSYDLTDDADSERLASNLHAVAVSHVAPEQAFGVSALAGAAPARPIIVVTDVVPEPCYTGACSRLRDLLVHLRERGQPVHVLLQRNRPEYCAINFIRRCADDYTLTPEIGESPPLKVAEPPPAAVVEAVPARPLLLRMRQDLVFHLSRHRWGVAMLNAARRALGRPALAYLPPAPPAPPPPAIPRSPGKCSRETAAALRDLAARLDPAAIVVIYPWLAECLEDLQTPALRMLDAIDVFHLRAERLLAKGLPVGWAVDYDEECRLLRLFDVIIAIQQEEAATFRHMVPELETITVGTTFPLRRASYQPDPDRVLMVGGPNAGNVHGLEAFLADIWPLVLQARPDAVLDICGALGAAVKGEHPRVNLRGYVRDLHEAYDQAAVVINPVWTGTGLKIKTVEALSYGKALVTTACGIEGMPGRPADACVVADDPAQFAQAVMALLEDSDQRRAQESAAFEYARRWLVPRVVYQELDRVLRQAQGTSPRMYADGV